MDVANCCGDRLRLTTFLRIVENGMPQRPSRFRRRIPPVEEDTYESRQLVREHACPSDAALNANASDAAPDHLVTLGHSCAEKPKKPDDTRDTATSQEGTSDTAKIFAPAGSVYEIPRSPTPDVSLPGPSDINKTDLNAKPTPSKERTSNEVINQAQEKSIVVALERSARPAASSSTRKRHLPVHGLTLLRTTTSDGLPELSV
jgi:hypothetical protein